MRTELSAGRLTVYAYMGLPLAVGVAFAVLQPVLVVLAAVMVLQGLVGLSFSRVFIDDSGFFVSKHGREEFVAFDQVKSVSVSSFGMPHVVLVVRGHGRVRRVRFLPEPSHGSFFLRNQRLKRQLEDIISSARRAAQASPAT